MNHNELNKQFSIEGTLQFSEKAEGFVVANIKNQMAEASIALQGAHVMTFQPAGDKPVIWLSEDAKFIPGKSIRGGVPVCWPWFGPHETNAEFPAHGFARTVNWQVNETRTMPDGSTYISFILPWNDQIKKQWPYDCKAEMQITVGSELKIELVTTNNGSEPMQISEALHTYFHISDIEKTGITGLENCEYLDKVGTPARKKQTGPITIASEVDRVYVNTAAECLIEDKDWKRAIVIKKEGSHSTVVWNPWVEKADKMGDLGKDGYRKMVCVESANALENTVTVKDKHILTVIYSTKKI